MRDCFRFEFRNGIKTNPLRIRDCFQIYHLLKLEKSEMIIHMFLIFHK